MCRLGWMWGVRGKDFQESLPVPRARNDGGSQREPLPLARRSLASVLGREPPRRQLESRAKKVKKMMDSWKKKKREEKKGHAVKNMKKEESYFRGSRALSVPWAWEAPSPRYLGLRAM